MFSKGNQIESESYVDSPSLLSFLAVKGDDQAKESQLKNQHRCIQRRPQRQPPNDKWRIGDRNTVGLHLRQQPIWSTPTEIPRIRSGKTANKYQNGEQHDWQEADANMVIPTGSARVAEPKERISSARESTDRTAQ